MRLHLQDTVRCRAAAPVLCLLVFAWMCLTVPDPGITWDETYYLAYAVRYGIWLRAATGRAAMPDDEIFASPQALARVRERPFDRDVLREWWGIDRLRPYKPVLGQKHPPLGKFVSYAFIWLLPFFDYVASARVGAAFLFALLCWCVFALAGQAWGKAEANWNAKEPPSPRERGGTAPPPAPLSGGEGGTSGRGGAPPPMAQRGWSVGLFSVLALLAMPRLVAHMRLATLEPALLLTTAFAFYAFLKAQDSRAWAVVCGVAFGLALLSKVNALAILPVAGLWALLFRKRKACLPLACMAVIGPLVFVVGWPALWREPLGGAALYLQDKFVDRSLIPAFYWGARYGDVAAPWHFAPVMFFLTTPLLVLAAAAAGLVRTWRGRRDAPGVFPVDALMALAAAVHVLAAASSPAARADGVRMMLSAFPFVAVLAGRGGSWAWEGLKAWGRARPRTAALLPAAAAIWALLPHAALHPFGLSYYNELIGGPWGARAAGMETTYWFDAFDQRAADFLNRNAPEGATVAYVPDEDRIHAWNQISGRLRPDLRLTHLAHDWDYLVVVSRRSWVENPDAPAMEQLREHMAKEPPAWTGYLTRLRRITVCRIYRGGG